LNNSLYKLASDTSEQLNSWTIHCIN